MTSEYYWEVCQECGEDAISIYLGQDGLSVFLCLNCDKETYARELIIVNEYEI